MQSFATDDFDRESGGTSDDDQDGTVEDRDEIDVADAEGDAEGGPNGDDEADNEDENEDEDAEPEDSQYSFGDGQNQSQLKRTPASQPSSTSTTSGPAAHSISAPTSHPNPLASLASVYDIVPTIAAPHSTSINAITATPDLRWVFSGGSDGYIRKFNWVETANGKAMLTVAQRHPFVDSVTKAGVLMSYWENSEEPHAKPSDEGQSISSVYSLAVHREALWLLSGLESGGINLQSVRHDEGKHITCLRGHTSAVSVLNLAQDEKSVLSGSWDKTVLDWDLNTGKVIRSFEGSGGQISALETRPISSLPVPEVSEEVPEVKNSFSSNNADKPRMNGYLTNGFDHDYKAEVQMTDNAMNGTAGSPTDSLFGGNDADSLFGDTENNEVTAPSGGNFGDDEDDEFSRAIANGIREQEQEQELENQHRDPEGDLRMMDSGDTLLDGSTDPHARMTGTGNHPSLESGALTSSSTLSNDLSHSDEPLLAGDITQDSLPDLPEPPPTSDSTFLAASIDGSLRIWDKRQRATVAKMTPKNVPPWCMNACWSPNGNFIYAGRRNGTVDEYSLYKGLQGAERSFKLPNNSGAVSAVRAMPNGRHLICASYDILRLYDLQEQQIFKHATVPFLIIPGHRTGVVSQLYIDPSCRYLISSAGNRGWEGSNTEVLLGYEIGVPR